MLTVGRLLLIVIISLCLTGCVGASLASSTGPRAAGRSWSMKSTQEVHVRESVLFNFVLVDWQGAFVQPVGVADYALADVGPNRLAVEFDDRGHFGFVYPFDSYAAGDVVKVTVTAFAVRGDRDWMKIGGEWLQNESPYDSADRRVAGDSITFHVYEAPIELSVPQASNSLDMQTGVLKIRRTDGAERSVYEQRATRLGFTVFTVPEDGTQQIRYVPDGDDLNPNGTTEVEFTVYDRAGRLYRVADTLTTP